MEDKLFRLLCPPAGYPDLGNSYTTSVANHICSNKYMRFGRGLKPFNILKKEADETFSSGSRT